MCTATAGWFNPAGKLTAEQVADQIVEFVWQGLLADPHAAPSHRPREGRAEASDWHLKELRESPTAPPEPKPDPIVEAVTKLKNAKLRQIQKQKMNEPA